MLSRARRVPTLARRAAAGPLLVRGGIFLTSLAALLTAYPAVLVTSRLVLALVLLAVLPAAAPRGRWPTVCTLAAVAGWLISTMGYGEPVTLWRLLGLSALLYLAHSLAALAAALPYDAVVAPDVLVRWVSRALLVVAGSAALSLALVVGADLVRGAYLAATLAGLVAAASLAALLAWLLRRR